MDTKTVKAELRGRVVDYHGGPDGRCWITGGEVMNTGYPVPLRIDQKRITVLRAVAGAYFLGRLPLRGERVYTTCGEKRCQNPLHAQVRGIRIHEDPEYTVAEQYAFMASLTTPTGNVEHDCWTWTGAVNPEGLYGRFQVQRNGLTVSRLSHRVSWAMDRGAWPEQRMENLCGNTLCANPRHWVLDES